jgi:hypothetical protein
MDNIYDFTGNVFSCGGDITAAQKLPASLGS